MNKNGWMTCLVQGIRAGPAGLGRSFSNSGQRVSLPNRFESWSKEDDNK